MGKLESADILQELASAFHLYKLSIMDIIEIIC